MSTTNKMSTDFLSRITSAVESQASSSRMSSNINAFRFLLSSPQTLLGATVAIIIMCAVLYVLVEFFSKNRFRGISFNIFSKLITVTDYINKFNTQIYSDFKKIKTYCDSYDASLYKTSDNEDYKKKVYFIDNDVFVNGTNKTVLTAIREFMGNIDSQRTFNKKIGAFFHPNPTFTKDITTQEFEDLKSIFEALYGEEFHIRFSDWFNYESIWNFAYKNSDGSLDTNLLKLKIYGITSITLTDTINEINEAIANNDFKSAMGKMGNYMDGIKELVANKAANKILENMIREWKVEKTKLEVKKDNETNEKTKEELQKSIEEYDNKINDLEKHRDSIMNDVQSLFFNNNTINYESISQQLEQSCSLLDDDAKNKFLKEFNEMSIGQGKLKNIVESTSFINVLNALRKSDYNVSQHTLKGIRNVHPHIIEVFKSINVNSTKEDKATILYNACFEVFNEFIYTKYTYNDVGEFMFLEDSDINDLSLNDLYNHILQYFNVHMILLYKDNIRFAKDFNTNHTAHKFAETTKFDIITDAHVSIARLKYLIHDYFVIIMEYNDKSFPDKNDIRDFWQKRVNSFGISMPGTKKFNKPRDAPDTDYVATRTNRSRQNKSGERRKLFNADGNVMDDLDQILKKNTPWELYKEYFRAIFSTRHPKIPFFQSIIAGIRFMFPDPNTVLDNFLAQLKGKPPSTSNKQINFDFSFKYNPYTRVIDGMIDRFSDPEVGADKMEEVVNVPTVDSSGLGEEAESRNAKIQTSGTKGATAVEGGKDGEIAFGEDPNAEKPEPKPEPKKTVCGPNETKVKQNRASKEYKCIPRSQESIERENKMKEAAKHCGPNQRPEYRARMKKYICVDNPCPPGQVQKNVKQGRISKLTCVPA